MNEDVVRQIAQRLRNRDTIKFFRLKGLDERELKKFIEGVLSDDYVYEQIHPKIEQDLQILSAIIDCLKAVTRNSAPQIFQGHRYLESTIRKLEDIRDRIRTGGFASIDNKILAEALYECISAIDSKDRRNFCSNVVGIQPPPYDGIRDCTISQNLKKDMFEYWWRTKGRGNPAALEAMQCFAEQFFKNNPDCENKQHIVAENMFVGGPFNFIQGEDASP